MYVNERNEQEWKKIPKWLESGTKDSIFRKLERTQLANLPFNTQKVQITTKVLDYLRNDNFLISQCIGEFLKKKILFFFFFFENIFLTTFFFIFFYKVVDVPEN